jgi:phosphate acetyltransferase
MSFIDNIITRAKANKKTIVLPETMDDRVLGAAEKIVNEDVANVILIGNKEEILEKNSSLNKCVIIDPIEDSVLTDELTLKLYELRKEKGLSVEEARKLLTEDYMYFACMLVKTGRADGVVSGACHSTANTLRPALQIIKTKENCKLVSAFFLMVVPDCQYGSNGTFIFADSGLVQDPTSEELAYIANSSADSFELLVQDKARVAMLSHSSMGSAKHELVDKVVNGVNLAKEMYPELEIDGELQLDAAIVPEVANSKAPDSKVAGHANVLIFPNLDAGNIGYKLVQRLAKAEAYGPITQGIAAPINDLSRGCSVDDIVGVVAITCVQAQG